MTKVYLIFRTQMFREAVSAILKTAPTIALVGVAEAMGLAMAEIAAQKPDVVFWEQTPDGTSTGELAVLLNSPTPPVSFCYVWTATKSPSGRPPAAVPSTPRI